MNKGTRFLAGSALLLFTSFAAAGGKIAILDDCDPTDPGWAPTGGCLLEDGGTTFAEFNALANSILSAAVVGHPAWRNEPSFVELETGQKLKVANLGGRTHTFTEVANFGGGRVPPLNRGLTPAPECATATNIAAGQQVEIRGLTVGNHLFECCIHPWMRALVRVVPEETN